LTQKEIVPTKFIFVEVDGDLWPAEFLRFASSGAAKLRFVDGDLDLDLKSTNWARYDLWPVVGNMYEVYYDGANDENKWYLIKVIAELSTRSTDKEYTIEYCDVQDKYGGLIRETLAFNRIQWRYAK
jgi:hypothetical protein